MVRPTNSTRSIQARHVSVWRLKALSAAVMTLCVECVARRQETGCRIWFVWSDPRAVRSTKVHNDKAMSAATVIDKAAQAD